MEEVKKQIFIEQVEKNEDVLNTLKQNFDCEEELADIFSFLSIVKKNLTNIANN